MRYVNSKRQKHSHDTVSPALHASLLFEATAFKNLDFFKTNFCIFLKVKIPQRPKQSRQSHFMTILYKILNSPKVRIPVPGIEPEPPG